MKSAISFDSVSRRFGAHEVLRGLTFDVAPGEVFALLGRNGAGKSTALKILLGFLRPHGGSSSVLGIPSGSLRPADRSRIAWVGEDHVLEPFMRVVDLIRFEEGTRVGFDRSVADRALQRCGIRTGQIVRRLSRGQRAQVALILATSNRPEVLIFDDPALGLDAVMRRELLDALIDLLSETGTSVLFSSHILTDVERMADRVGILHGGALLVDATLDDIKRRVRRVVWGPKGRAPLPSSPHVLAGTSHRSGLELTVLDGESGFLAELEATGTVSEPVAPTLEELFIALTSSYGNVAPEGHDVAADEGVLS